MRLVLLAAGAAAACSPASRQHEANVLESGGAAVEYADCTLQTKADAGTFRDWQKCACEVDKAHHVDSGKCGP